MDYRLKMSDLGWKLRDSEVPIETAIFKGRIDDVMENPDAIIAVDYVSSPFARAEKLNDAAISAGFLRYVMGIDASAVVVSRDGITEIPDYLIEEIWRMIENVPKLLEMGENRLLDFANPASGFCRYCANSQCGKNQMMF